MVDTFILTVDHMSPMFRIYIEISQIEVLLNELISQVIFGLWRRICFLLDIDMIDLPLLQFAAIALMFRQTNVVWAIFVTCVGILEILKLPADSNIQVRKEELQHTTSSDGTLWMLSMDAEGPQSVRRRRAPANAEVDYIRPDSAVQGKDSYRSGIQGSNSYCLVLSVFEHQYTSGFQFGKYILRECHL